MVSARSRWLLEQPAAEPEVAPQILGLAAAVGLSEAPTLEMIPIPAFAVPELVAVGVADRAQPVALLAPPELQTAPAPVGLAEPLADRIPSTPRTPPPPLALADPLPDRLPPPMIPDESREETPAVPIALAEPTSTPPAIPEEAPPAVPAALAESDSEPPAVPAEVPPPAPLAESVPHILLPLPAVPQFQPSPEPRTEPLGRPPLTETTAERPPSGSWLKFAPLQDYSAAATRAMRPAAPPAKILMPDSGPRMTLPGPALPAQLNVRENLHVVTVLGDRPQRRGIPGWLVSFLVMASLLLAGGAVLFYVLPASHSTADAKTAAPEPPQAPVVESSHPLAQFIEVTGIRFVMDLNKKSEIHYLVVNHSASELSDMTVFVTVRAANAKAGQPPLCRFSFRSTGLGPFESKEMISPIEKMAHPVALPDWRDLHADVQIGQ